MPLSVNHTAITSLTGPGVVVIVRLPGAAGLDEIAAAAVEGGARALEVTMNTPGALDWLRSARDRFGDDLTLGMGTVLDADDAARAVDAGAQFIVAPDLNPAVVATTKAAGALAIPGALTPTEIVTAWRAGADIVKVFPAGLGGPRYFADVLAPLNHIPLLATGGIDESNAADFIRAGVAAIAVGASIVNPRVIAERRFDLIASRIRRVVDVIAEARGVGLPVAAGS